MTDRFSATPDPVATCGTLTVEYDFTGLPAGITMIVVRIEWGADVPPTEVTIQRANPSANVTVPAGATSILLSDTTGISDVHAVDLTIDPNC